MMASIVYNNPRVNIARLIKKIQPTSSELKKARSYSLSCRKRLNKSFDLKKFKGIGSHTRDAAIRHYSDLDFLVVLSRNEVKWAGKIINSNTFLSKVSQDLNDRYINTTIRKDGQAVVAKFSSGQNSMDIVPAFLKAGTISIEFLLFLKVFIANGQFIGLQMVMGTGYKLAQKHTILILR